MLVEPPGIAPGSGPLIAGAFIAIVGANPDRTNIGAVPPVSKVRAYARAQSGVWLRNHVSWRLA